MNVHKKEFETGSSVMTTPFQNEFDSSFIDDKAMQMMKKMGYKVGIGLGKFEQGITNAIDIAPKVGTLGLGFISKIDTKVDWDFTQEFVEVEESLDWVENGKTLDLAFEKLQSFLNVGNSEEVASNSFDFCDRQIFEDIVKAKEIFNEFDIEDLNKARARANPFERIYSVFFMNRAALKLANIDAASNFIFSNIDKNIHHNGSKGPFYFADVCAGPGGFSEYILWRRSWLFKGFGMTLKSENDFKLNNSCCISPHSFQAFYGTQGDGNVCCPDNIADFKNKVLFQTNGLGVHFMTSDGGFCVDGNENFQEILSKNIYLCQCLVALEIVRTHGNFVTKLFDVFTRFSVGLIFLMYKCFKKVSILKPNSSRPANAERYLICYDLQNNNDVEQIRKYLRFISKKLWELKDKEQIDILEIIPLKKIKNDFEFFEFIKKSNNNLGKSQIVALRKLDAFCRNPLLRETRQNELRTKCLEYWQIPDTSKKAWELNNENLNQFLYELIHDSDWFRVSPIRVENEKSLQQIRGNRDDWSCCMLYSSSKKNFCNFYAGFSSQTCKWHNDKWIKVKSLRLSKGTLLYGEMVKEIVQSDKMDEDCSLHTRYTLHIIDAVYLGDICLTNLPFQERMELISIYAESINQEFHDKLIHIRKKPMYFLNSISFSSVLSKSTDQQSYRTTLPITGYNSVNESHEVNSIMFLQHHKDLLLQSTFVLRAQLCLEDIEDVGLLHILENDLEKDLENREDEQMYICV